MASFLRPSGRFVAEKCITKEQTNDVSRFSDIHVNLAFTLSVAQMREAV
jgi:hypothetical protein